MKIPSHLYSRLYNSLITNAHFESDHNLRALFVDSRLALWRYHVPAAQTQDMRVRTVIQTLFDQYDEHQQNALVLLLSVIQEHTAPTHALYRELTTLIQELTHNTILLQPNTPAWDQALTHYFALLHQRYDHIQIFGQPRPIKLQDIFTKVYVLDQPRAFHRFDIRQLQAEPKGMDYANRLNALELLAHPHGHRLFIFGKPGSGKTTFLKYATLQAATPQSPKVPIFIELKKWLESNVTLLEFIAQQFQPCDIPELNNFVENLLQNGKALLLFDSLDEISSQQDLRLNITKAIKAFAQRYLKTQIVLTCRNAATDYTFEGFTYVEIADFDELQIAAFVERWFDNHKTRSDAFLKELAMPEHHGLRELCRTPLLLAMLCLAFEVNLTFPQRRVELYADALDALLRKWDRSRNIKRDMIYQGLSVARKHQLFARIAADMFEQDIYFVPQKQIENYITRYLSHLPYADKGDAVVDGEIVLKAIESQHGILVEQARHIYAFAHLTFQEYYTARYIVDNAHRHTLLHLLAHITDTRWREVILIATSLLDQANDFFVHFQNLLQQQIQAEPELQRLLTWAARQAADTAAASTALHRCNYCLLAANELREWPKVRLQALNLALVLDHEKRFVQPTTRLPTRSRRTSQLSEHQPSYLTLDRMLMQFLHRAQMLTLAHNYNLTDTAPQTLQPMLREILIYCQKVDAQALYQQLQALQLPAANNAQHLEIFVTQVRALLHTQRDLVYQWQLTAEQAQHLADYFYSVLLFVECLDVAYVTNRTQLEASILDIFHLSSPVAG